jgi:hypothetical protein
MGVGGHSHAPIALPPEMTRYPHYRRLGGPQGWSGWVRKISPPLRFDARTVQPVASRVKRLKIFGLYNCRQQYSAGSNIVTESTCRSQSKCLYFMYVQTASPHRPIGSNIVTPCTCVSNSKFVKFMYELYVRSLTAYSL